MSTLTGGLDPSRVARAALAAVLVAAPCGAPLPSRLLLWLDGTDRCVRIQHLTSPVGRT
jgi:hypothetical protein